MMNSNLVFDSNSERRCKPRIPCSYPAIVQSRSTRNGKFIENATLVNLSATGLYLQVSRSLQTGDKLLVTISLTNGLPGSDIPKLAAEGIVVRTEPLLEGNFGVAIKIERYRFL